MSQLSGNPNICWFFVLIKLFLGLKALFNLVGDVIVKMEQEKAKPPSRSTESKVDEETTNSSLLSSILEQEEKIKPMIRSTQSNLEPSSSCSSLAPSFQYDDVNQKTSFLAQNNLPSVSGEPHCSSVQTANDQANPKDFPNWIVRINKKDETEKVFFDFSKFNLKLIFANSSFSEWYKENLETANWKDFNSYTNELVDVCVKQLETYFSTKQKPKQTRMMHSTERHHLSAIVANHFPFLVSKYTEFKLKHNEGDLKWFQTKTTPNRSTFMVMYLNYKLLFNLI